MNSWTRRRLIQSAVAGGVGLTLARFALAEEKTVSETPLPERAIELHNTHTSETVSVVFKRGEAYNARAIVSLRNVMRDHRNGESHDIDPALYDQLYDLALAAKCDPRFEIMAPAPLSVVCFRQKASDEENQALLERVNASGEVFISHTVLNRKFTLRIAIGNMGTTRRHVQRAWDLVRSAAG